jgi:hypothetical protein
MMFRPAPLNATISEHKIGSNEFIYRFKKETYRCSYLC